MIPLLGRLRAQNPKREVAGLIRCAETPIVIVLPGVGGDRRGQRSHTNASRRSFCYIRIAAGQPAR